MPRYQLRGPGGKPETIEAPTFDTALLLYNQRHRTSLPFDPANVAPGFQRAARQARPGAEVGLPVPAQQRPARGKPIVIEDYLIDEPEREPLGAPIVIEDYLIEEEPSGPARGKPIIIEDYLVPEEKPLSAAPPVAESIPPSPLGETGGVDPEPPVEPSLAGRIGNAAGAVVEHFAPESPMDLATGALDALGWAAQPLDQFGESIVRGLTLQPQGTYSERVEGFGERPWWQQLAIGAVTDPTAAIGAVGRGGRVARQALRQAPEIVEEAAEPVLREAAEQAPDALRQADEPLSGLPVIEDVEPPFGALPEIEDALPVPPPSPMESVGRVPPEGWGPSVQSSVPFRGGPVERPGRGPVLSSGALPEIEDALPLIEDVADDKIAFIEAIAPDGPRKAPQLNRGLEEPAEFQGFYDQLAGLTQEPLRPREPWMPVIAQEAATPSGVRTAEAAAVGKRYASTSSNPAEFLTRVRSGQIPGERLDQTALRLHEAALNTAERHANEIVRLGNEKLSKMNVGARIGVSRAARPEDIGELDELYKALHGPSRVEAGEVAVPAKYQQLYGDLRGLMDWESAARLDFEPDMATVNDYFYRGWKPPEGMFADTGTSRGQLVSRPAFKKPRADATYEEMRQAGFEPLYWNPYEQWKVARMQGMRYRQQMELVDTLKHLGEEVARPHLGGAVPDGWRVPKVGPAFEGKPFAMTGPAGLPEVGHTRRWMVPDRVANTLENIYGVPPNLGKVTPFGRSFDVRKAIDTLVFLPKRAKLVGSFFQQVDFLTRSGVGSWHGMVNALFTGHPVESVKHLALYPKTAADILGANFVPSWRRSITSQLHNTNPLIPGRAGVNLKGISDAGLSISDVTILPQDIDAAAREIANETGLLGKSKSVGRAINNLEGSMRRGLFEGVYPAAIINDVQHNIAPIVGRIYPHLTDDQMNGVIARLANTRYSTLPASQSVVQNRFIREGLRRVMFSVNESEGLLRQAIGAVKGPQKRFWAENWLGGYLFLMATAGTVHFAATGEALPAKRFVPVWKDKHAPFGYGYNQEFAAPTIYKGKGDIEVMLDVVGQLDTVFRVMDPETFITSRESVPLRAFETQRNAQDFYKNPINEIGPGGVVSRTVQLAQDLFAPIGIGQGAINILSEEVPEAQMLVSGGEQKLGTAGQLVQATGVNLRAETIDQSLRRMYPDWDVTPEKTNDKRRAQLIQEVYGARDRLGKERFQDRIWELFPPTEAEVQKFEQKMEQEFGPRLIPRRRMVRPKSGMGVSSSGSSSGSGGGAPAGPSAPRPFQLMR